MPVVCQPSRRPQAPLEFLEAALAADLIMACKFSSLAFLFGVREFANKSTALALSLDFVEFQGHEHETARAPSVGKLHQQPT